MFPRAVILTLEKEKKSNGLPSSSGMVFNNGFLGRGKGIARKCPCFWTLQFTVGLNLVEVTEDMIILIYGWALLNETMNT